MKSETLEEAAPSAGSETVGSPEPELHPDPEPEPMVPLLAQRSLLDTSHAPVHPPTLTERREQAGSDPATPADLPLASRSFQQGGLMSEASVDLSLPTRPRAPATSTSPIPEGPESVVPSSTGPEVAERPEPQPQPQPMPMAPLLAQRAPLGISHAPVDSPAGSVEPGGGRGGPDRPGLTPFPLAGYGLSAAPSVQRASVALPGRSGAPAPTNSTLLAGPAPSAGVTLGLDPGPEMAQAPFLAQRSSLGPLAAGSPMGRSDSMRATHPPAPPSEPLAARRATFPLPAQPTPPGLPSGGGLDERGQAALSASVSGMLATGVATQSSDGSIVFTASGAEAPPLPPLAAPASGGNGFSGSGAATVQRAGPSIPPSPASAGPEPPSGPALTESAPPPDAGGPGSASAPAAGPSAAELEQMAEKLYERIRRHLKMELRIDLERFGQGTYLRR